MSDWLDRVGFFQRPIGPMEQFATDEMGNPVFRNALSGYAYAPQIDYGPSAEEYIARVRNIEGGGNALAQAAPPLREQARNVLAALVEGFTAPGRAARGEPITYGDVASTALDYGLVANVAGVPAGALSGGSFRAYHGSPHDFDRFSMDHIGTGEGAQAYGHGLYFSEAEDVARQYRNMRRVNDIPPQIKEDLRALGNLGFDSAGQAMTNIRSHSDWRTRWDIQAHEAQIADRIDDFLSRQPGGMYEVQINASPESLLDLDAPVGRQSETIQAALPGDPSRTGVQALHDYGGATRGAISQMLLDAGIPGSRYLDSMSRVTGQGTRNYVIFDDSIIDIIRKYGVAAAAPMLGMTVAQLQQEMQSQGVTE